MRFLGTHDFNFIHFNINSILIHILAENCNALPPKIFCLFTQISFEEWVIKNILKHIGRQFRFPGLQHEEQVIFVIMNINIVINTSNLKGDGKTSVHSFQNLMSSFPTYLIQNFQI